MALPGMVLDKKYEILKELGRGGMSTVYLAMDMRLNKPWAVKEIPGFFEAGTDIMLESIRMEADVLKKADHPVLPRIVDIIYYESSLFVVMDYIEGMPLDKVVALSGPQPQEKVVSWAKSLCDALIYLHSMNPPVIYRDMKPSNIMLKTDGTVKLIDFGTAKEFKSESGAAMAFGTIGYAAPEQFGDRYGREVGRTDERTDIYSLGITIYYLLTGIEPDSCSRELKPIRMINSSLSGGLEKVIIKCTEIDPERRYQNCEELLLHLNNYTRLDDEYKRSCKNNIKRFAAVLLMIVCFAVMSVFGRYGIERERENNYDYYMNQGYYYTASGEYEKAVDFYINAITQIDGGRSDAYLAILKLYINYMNEPETGLSCVSYYIDQNYEVIRTNDLLITQIAMYYFEIVKDYKSSEKYFLMLADADDSMMEGYKTIASIFSDLNVDYELYKGRLNDFEMANSEYQDVDRKILNYRLLCDAYSVCIADNKWALEGMERCAENGLEILSANDNYNLKYDSAEYFVSFEQSMSVAREGLGDFYKGNKAQSESYYKEAVACCKELLETVSSEDKVIPGVGNGANLREAKYCQMARLYEKLEMPDDACMVFEAAEKEMDAVSVYVGHLSLLCSMESVKTPDVEAWDYELLHSLYVKGEAVTGIDRDYRWKRLEIKLLPLFEKGESDRN